MAVNSRTHAAKIAAIKAKPRRQPKKIDAKPAEVTKIDDYGQTGDDDIAVGVDEAPAQQGNTAPTAAKTDNRFSMLVAGKICTLIAVGQPLQKICAQPDMPSVSVVQGWIRKYPKFKDMYEEARGLQADYVADEMLMIVQELRQTTIPGRASALRAAADLLAKQAEWRSPRKYGPKMDLNINERPKTPDEIKAEIARLRTELGVPDGRIARIK